MPAPKDQIPEKLVPQPCHTGSRRQQKGLNAATASFNVKPKTGPFANLGEEFEVLRTCCQPLNLFGQESGQCCQNQAEEILSLGPAGTQDRIILHPPLPLHCSSLRDLAELSRRERREWVLLYRD